MAESSSKSWDDIVDHLRGVANELRAASGQNAASSAEEEAAAARLKKDVTRLQQSASELLSKLADGLDSQRSDAGSVLDRERAMQAASQVRAGLDELLGIAKSITVDLGSSASENLTRTEPELKSAIRTLEDVAESAAAWVRAAIDNEGRAAAPQPRRDSPPLDDF